MRQERRRRPGEARQVLEVIVERLQLAVPGVAQHLVEPAFLGLAGEERAADVERLLDLRRDLLEHREAARDVEAADHHRQPGGAELAGEVEGARKLVGLDADQADQRPPAGRAMSRDDLLGPMWCWSRHRWRG